jgi:hypothetical protein
MKISYTKQTTYRNGSLKNQGYEFGSNYAILIFPLCDALLHVNIQQIDIWLE